MLYAIMSQDIPDSLALRQSVRDQHLERLESLKKKGRLVLAGPHLAIDSEEPDAAGFTGSLVVAEFESLEAARLWADQDPYKTAGVYAEIAIKPFKQSFP